MTTAELIANYEAIARANRPDWPVFIEEARANPLEIAWEVLEAAGLDDWGTDLYGAVRNWINNLKEEN